MLQLYGTGNIPRVKESFIQLLADAKSNGILVVAATQCYTGSVLMGHYAVGHALEEAGTFLERLKLPVFCQAVTNKPFSLRMILQEWFQPMT